MIGRYLCAVAAITTGAVIASVGFTSEAPPGEYVWTKPTWAPTPIVPADNPMSEARVQLGRYLFYSKLLSSNGAMSCGSCHQQKKAFTDGQKTHIGVTGEFGRRSAMTLTNVAFLSSYTWANPNIATLEKQMLVPLFADHPIEMGMTGKEELLVQRLSSEERFPTMFKAAFPEEHGAITLTTITKAIASFERALLSFSSPYDRYQHGEPQAISESAKRGEDLFFGERLECYHCHGGINFTDNHQQQGQAFPERGFHNTGLYNEDGQGAYKKSDSGLREITEKPEDEGKFRTPTLRNVAVTAPYMHDGSLPTLEAVIRDHYAIKGHGAMGGKGPNPRRSEFIEGFEISDSEVQDLIAFLRSLTDEQFLSNPAFSDPNEVPTRAGTSLKKRVADTTAARE